MLASSFSVSETFSPRIWSDIAHTLWFSTRRFITYGGMCDAILILCTFRWLYGHWHASKLHLDVFHLKETSDVELHNCYGIIESQQCFLPRCCCFIRHETLYSRNYEFSNKIENKLIYVHSNLEENSWKIEIYDATANLDWHLLIVI